MKKLKQQRKLCGMTQWAIAKEADVLYSRIVYAETGRRPLRQDEIHRIKNVLSRRARQIAGAIA